MSSEYIEQLRELDREADERMEEREKKRMLMEAEIEKERRDAEHTHQMEMQRMWMTFFDKMLHSGPPVHQSWPSHPQTNNLQPSTFFPHINNQNFPTNFHHASSSSNSFPTSTPYYPPRSPSP